MRNYIIFLSCLIFVGCAGFFAEWKPDATYAQLQPSEHVEYLALSGMNPKTDRNYVVLGTLTAASHEENTARSGCIEKAKTIGADAVYSKASYADQYGMHYVYTAIKYK